MQQNSIKILFIKRSWAPNEIYKKTMTDDYEAQEVIKYAVKKRQYLIQEATGTLSDDELEDEEGSD